ncbi:MAG: ABC transporter ATP-binding protein [Candidatus Wukongarchaeota archaeon]|nr:ABC transporter ATP-binding protein [Candidatus Wukongarchaeota archaeon]
MEAAILTEGLTKRFSQKVKGKKEATKGKKNMKTVVDHINIEVPNGQFLGLLGPNGAGKTTLTKMLVTLLLPDEGTALVNGYDILKEPAKVRGNIGHLHGETGGRSLYWRLSGRDNLKLFATLQEVPKEIAKKRIEAMISYFELEKIIDREVRKYSTGEKVRTMLARTLIHNPPILILDEPTIGLDAATAVETRKFFTILNRELGKTIVFTSHVMSEVEELCERIAIMDKGIILADTDPHSLSALVKEQQKILIHILNMVDKKALIKYLEDIEGVKEVVLAVERSPITEVSVVVEDELKALPILASKLGEAGYKVTSIEVEEPTLEEAFIKLTTKKRE